MRDLLRKFLIDPDELARLGGKVMDQVEKSLPAIMTGTGTYLVTKMVGEQVGFEQRKKGKKGQPQPQPSIMPPIQINLPFSGLEAKTAGGSVGEQIEPPENWMSWQKDRQQQEITARLSEKNSRNALRDFLRKA